MRRTGIFFVSFHGLVVRWFVSICDFDKLAIDYFSVPPVIALPSVARRFIIHEKFRWLIKILVKALVRKRWQQFFILMGHLCFSMNKTRFIH